MAIILLANVFQVVYALSVTLMLLSSFEKIQVNGFYNTTHKQKGEFFGAAIAMFTFTYVQIGITFGYIEYGEYPTCPISLFTWSVFYNLEEYAKVDLFYFFKDKKSDSIH